MVLGDAIMGCCFTSEVSSSSSRNNSNRYNLPRVASESGRLGCGKQEKYQLFPSAHGLIYHTGPIHDFAWAMVDAGFLSDIEGRR